jgi:hypothetical protein
MSAQTTQDIELRIGQVESRLQKARGAWSGWGTTVSSWIGAAPKASVLHDLDHIESVGVRPWKQRGLALSNQKPSGPAGQKLLNAWVRDGNQILENITGIAKDGDNSTIQQILIDTAVASAKDAAEVVAAPALFLRAHYRKLLILAGVLVAVFVWFKFRKVLA